jgi:hypothetical protein
VDVPRLRLQHQALIGPLHARPEHAVQNLLAVQSQDYSGAKWAIAQRTRGADDAAVNHAFREGRILRTHVMRPTWHFVTPADIRWLLALTSPRVHAFNAPYYRKHGLDAAAHKRSVARIEKALARGEHLTREELGRAIDPSDSALTGERLATFVMRAELDAVIASGAMRGKQHTYALLDERAPASEKLTRDGGLARLAHRYVSGHGPAQARDLAWWSGLTIADATRGFTAAEGLERAVVNGNTYWFAPAKPLPKRAAPVVHLLPNYDELLIAFKDRSFAFDPGVSPIAGVLAAHFVVVDGRIVGGYRRTLDKANVTLRLELLRSLSAAERKALNAAAERFAHSLGLAVRLELETVAAAR